MVLERADLANGVAEPFTTGQRFEYGTRAWPIYAGLGYTLDWLEALGWQNIYSHIAALSEYLKASVVERPYLRLLTPRAYEQSSGLTSFVIEGQNAGQVGQILREKQRIINRVIPHYNALRISTQYFNNRQDVDLLMDAIDQIVYENTGKTAG
jgi:selenocysteine lyase/cysteine desulfurase